MLKRIKNLMKSQAEEKAKEVTTNEIKPIDEISESDDQHVDDPNLEVQTNQDDIDQDDSDSDEDYISDEEWEAMTPEERAEIEAEEAEEDDDEDYISDEEWEAMTPEEREAWENEGMDDEEDEDSKPQPENLTDEDNPDYISTSPEVVGFDDFDQQQDMYDVACEDIEPEDSILDFGCGRGDLYDFVYRRDGVEPKYKGVDINQQLIDAGIEKYAPNVVLECKDWNQIEDSDRSDWCVNIGSLCARYDGSAKDDDEIVKETIDKMMSLCTVGSVLILFSSYMPNEVKEEEFLVTDPKDIFDYTIKKYGKDSGNVSIDHSYSDSAYKITILRQQQ